MRSLLVALSSLALAVAVATGCSSSSSPPPAAATTGGDDGGGAASPEAGNPNFTTVSFQMAESVPGGGEIFDCQYVQLPNVAQWMVAASHNYTPGSHHMLLYTTALTAIPPGGGQVQNCYEGTGNNIMSDARGVLYGGQTPTGSETYPPGIGLPTTANEVLIFQVHYLNAGSAALNAEVHVDLTFDAVASDITTQAGTIFFYDPFIDVPAGATAKASMRCLIPSDITLLYASSHYHARGVGYGAYLDPAVDQLGATPFYTSTSWSSPDNAQLSMAIAGGSRIRFECDYDNSAGTQSFYAGQSAQTNEMCMFIGTYYPEMGQSSDYCKTSPDMFGTGTATCASTLSCYQACGGAVPGGGGGGGLQLAVPDCEQACMVQSCPTASAPLVTFTTCLQSSCKSQCATPTSSACTTCVASNCGAQYTACQSHTCN